MSGTVQAQRRETAAAAGLDVERVRAEFPILGRTVGGRPLIYLDSAATAQKPAVVLEAMDAFYRESYASVARGVTSASEMLRQRSVTDLTADLRDLARRHPGAFMAAAAVAGFAAARFLRSSASRRSGAEAQERGYRS